MRILILGNNHAAESFFNYFVANNENIVFTTHKNYNFADFQKTEDMYDFISANSIELVLIIDEEYINSGFSEYISSKGVTVFAPDIDAVSISASKAAAKRFMYKNNIQSSNFLICEKQQQAYEYIKNLQGPVAIKPDNHNPRECTKFAETTNQAQKIISNLFANGNSKIIIEDYIEGKNIKIYILSNGFQYRILGISAIYQNNIGYFEPEFLSDDIIENIIQNIINPTIEGLSDTGNEYIGILGFDIILDNNNDAYLASYNSFFDDINVDFYTKGCNADWLKIFEKTIVGDIFSDFNYKQKNEYMLTIRQDDEIRFISAKTKNILEFYLKELYDNKEYFEAEKIWKY